VKKNASNEVVDAHVVLLTNFIPPYRLPLYEALADRVACLTVLVSTPVEANRSWRPDHGRLDVRVQRTVSLRRLWRHPAGFSDAAYVHFPWDTLRQLRTLRPDIVVSSELGFRSVLSAIYCLGSRRARLVLWADLSERTEQGRGRMRSLVRRWLFRRANRVVVSGASGHRYVERFGVPPSRIVHVAQPALPDFAKAGATERTNGPVRNLLFAGQLTERKGLLPFLEVLADWASAHPGEEVTLTVAGSGPLKATLESFESPGRLAIRVVGEQDPRELPALFEQADAFVFPTLADQWGLVVNEALAAGVPVIGSIHSQAVEELCEDGTTGWLFDPDDKNSTRPAIDRALATSPADLAVMRRRATERVRTLTPESTADRMVAILRDALSVRMS